MRRKKGNKLFALVLAAAMVLSMSGTMAFASQANQSASTAKSVQEAAAEQDLSFKSSKVSKTTDDAPFTNTLSGAEGKVTYTSSNAKVATVDANGKVTILGVGTVTIKASGIGSSTGKTQEASFTLTVSEPAAEAEPVSAVSDGVAEVTVGEEDDADAAEGEEGDAEETEDEEGDAEVTEDEEGDAEDIEDEDSDAEDIEDEDADAESIEDEDADAEVTEGEDGDTEEIEAEDADAEDLEAEDADEEDIDAEDSEEAESGSRIATATLPTDENLIALATYSLAPADKESQDLSFEAGDTVTKSLESAPFRNPLNGAVGEVTYDSSDESVAIVDSQGWVTIEGDGTAIITATASGDEEYDLAKLSYLLAVNDEEGEAQPTGDSMNIRVAISWEGDTESMRPEYVEVTLLADGEEQETVKVTEQEDGNWYYVWKDLPVYTDGKDKIEYTVKEINTPTGYTPTYGEWFDEENNTYSIVISDTWGVESDTGGVHGPKTSDIDAAVYSMYLLILASAVIVMLGVRRRTVRK